MEEKVVALYIRLSKADEVTGESESIKSQRTLLHQFLDKHPDLANYPRYEAVDDGYSGTNGNRPMFQQMVQRAEKGELQAVIVKDSSRLFRDYSEAGKFMDYNFPMWNVRYIAIGDGYDSDDYKGITGGMEQALRNIVYASYPKMLSRNIKSSKTMLAKQGKFIGCNAPFGYAKDESDRHKLVVDEESAKTVRLIFDLALEGKTCSQIALHLNKNNIETPSSHFRRKFPNSKKYTENPNNRWFPSTISTIIGNIVYTGTLASIKRVRVDVCSKETKPCEPIIVENTHVGIVAKEEFEKVQKMRKTREPSKEVKRDEYALRGVTRCGHCKNMLDRVKGRTEGKSGFYFNCRASQFINATICQKKNRFDEETLEGIVYRAISDYVALLNISLTVAKTSGEKNQGDYLSITKEISQLELEIKKQKSVKFQDYERYTAGSLSKELFLQRKEKADLKIKELQEGIAEKEKARNSIPDCTSHTTAELEQLVEEFQHCEKLTSALVQAFVKEIFVFDKETIEIIFNFNDFL